MPEGWQGCFTINSIYTHGGLQCTSSGKINSSQPANTGRFSL